MRCVRARDRAAWALRFGGKLCSCVVPLLWIDLSGTFSIPPRKHWTPLVRCILSRIRTNTVANTGTRKRIRTWSRYVPIGHVHIRSMHPWGTYVSLSAAKDALIGVGRDDVAPSIVYAYTYMCNNCVAAVRSKI